MEPLKKEFLDLFHASGWTQAELARKLEMTRGGVNGIITGDAIPSMTIVKLFRLLVQGEKPHLRLPMPGKNDGNSRPYVIQDDTVERSIESRPYGWENEVLGQLDNLSEEDRLKVIEVLRATLKLVPKKKRPVEHKRVA